MNAGDVVRAIGKDDLMTVERVEKLPHTTFIYCVWFDEKGKLRRLRYYSCDLIVEGRASAGNMRLK